MSSALTALRATIADAHASGTSLRIAGAGTWLDAGRPVHANATLSTRELTGVVEYVPGDLVISVRAGTTMREIAAVTAEHDQWLALDPFGSADTLDDATIGAVVATASSGPLAHGFGRIRDLVLGLSFVSGDNTPVRAGGRVVKNVAGFDLVRLTTGAWGTLGVITELSLRLHARPSVDRSFAVRFDVPTSVDARDAQRRALVERLNTAPLLAVTNTLSAAVVLCGESAASITTAHALSDASLVLVVRAMGNPTRVAAQRAALTALGDVVDVDTSIWRTVRSLREGATSFRLSGAPMETVATWHRAESWLERHQASARLIIEPWRGGVRVMSDLGADSRHAFDLPARAIADRLPRNAWSMQRSAISDPIAQQIRRVFDPKAILNRGMLGDIDSASEAVS